MAHSATRVISKGVLDKRADKYHALNEEKIKHFPFIVIFSLMLNL